MSECLPDENRLQRLRELESQIKDSRSIINVDCLLDAVQSVVEDCDHPAIRKIKNVDAFVSRCKFLIQFVLLLVIFKPGIHGLSTMIHYRS